MFIEASVTEREKINKLNKINQNLEEPLVIAPSCTMRFYPMPMKLKTLLASERIGKVTYFNYVTGQYLPSFGTLGRTLKTSTYHKKKLAVLRNTPLRNDMAK